PYLRLLRDPRERNPKLPCLSVQVWTLNTEGLGGFGHPPSMVLEDRGDVVALESQARLAQIPHRHERRGGAIEAKGWQQVLYLNHVVGAVRHDAVDGVVQLLQIAGPVERAQQRQGSLRERPRRQSARGREVVEQA